MPTGQVADAGAQERVRQLRNLLDSGQIGLMLQLLLAEDSYYARRVQVSSWSVLTQPTLRDAITPTIPSSERRGSEEQMTGQPAVDSWLAGCAGGLSGATAL